jgi:hypothetical protein
VFSKPGKLEQRQEWMDLKAVQSYACVSERTVRSWINRAQNPLPAVQVEKGKILVKRSQFDRWLEAHAYRPTESIDVGRIVDEVFTEFKRVN